MLGDNSSAYGINLDEQNHILNLMDNFISTMRVHGKKQLMTFQKGILISNLSLRNLYKDLKDYIGIEYIITRRHNQDVIISYSIYLFIKIINYMYLHLFRY